MIEKREQGEGFLPLSVHLSTHFFSLNSVSEIFFLCSHSVELAVIFQVSQADHYSLLPLKRNMGAFIGENLIHQAYLCSRGMRMALTADSQPVCNVTSAVERFLNCSTGKMTPKKNT